MIAESSSCSFQELAQLFASLPDGEEAAMKLTSRKQSLALQTPRKPKTSEFAESALRTSSRSGRGFSESHSKLASSMIFEHCGKLSASPWSCSI